MRDGVTGTGEIDGGTLRTPTDLNRNKYYLYRIGLVDFFDDVMLCVGGDIISGCDSLYELYEPHIFQLIRIILV